MPGLVNISRAATLALHSVLILKNADKKLNAFEVAEKLNASGHHVAKVLQKLARSGILNSWKGPGGGFTLKKSPEEISLMTIYESIDGKLSSKDACCTTGEVCPLAGCIWGSFGDDTHMRFKDYLQSKKLSDFR